MPIIEITPVKRDGMKLLISLFGLSETGKTLSALRLAAGIEPDPAKRGLLDTEGGERGRAYVDHVPGGYMYGSLTPPFAPERYIEALRDFVEAGVTTLVVDSVSHAWFAEGGVLDMVENATAKNDLAKWAKPKRQLGKLTRAWLSCGLHLILCSRGKQIMVEVERNGKKGYEPGPVVPVQEKSLRYDMTIMAQMLGDGRFSIGRDDGGKCPGALRPIFQAGEVMDEAMGKKLVAWIGGQDVRTPAQRKLMMEAADAAGEGTTELRRWWDALDGAEKQLVGDAALRNLQSQAAVADREIRQRQSEDQPATDADPFADRPALDGGVQRASASQRRPEAQEAA